MPADLSGLPVNIRFILSTRPSRMDSLHLPRGTPKIECAVFSLPETFAFSRLNFGEEVSDDWVEQYHALSNGIPRVQAQAIKRGAGSLSDTLDALRPSGKGLNDVLAELFKEALDKL